MANEPTDYDARQAAKFNGHSDRGDYVEQVKDWCQTAEHARYMFKAQRHRLTRFRESLRDTQDSIDDTMAALNAVSNMILEEGWSHDEA